MAKQVIQPVKVESKKAFIGTIKDAPIFCVSNDFIIRGYRINFNTFERLTKSLFQLHNETMNIWTHLLGAFFFVLLLGYVIFMIDTQGLQPIQEKVEPMYAKTIELMNDVTSYEYMENLEEKLEKLYDVFDDEEVCPNIHYFVEHAAEQIYGGVQNISSTAVNAIGEISYERFRHRVEDLMDWEERTEVGRWPLIVFILSAVFCLSCSAACHTYTAHSLEIYKLMVRLDYAGIAILIAGSTYPPVYYVFYCNPIYYWTYLSLISLTGVIVFICTLSPQLQEPRNSHYRGGVFLIFGLLAGTPAIHFFTQINSFMPFIDVIPSLLGMAFFYIFGCFFYVGKFPERCCPGKFDYFGSSHQIWHCMVLAAAIIHYVGAMDAFHARQITKCEIV